SNVADLGGQIAGHRVDRIGEVFPRAGHTFDVRLAAEFSFGGDFAGAAGDFRSKRTELVDHGIDSVFQFQDFTFDIHGDGLGKVSIGDGGGDGSDVTDLGRQVAGHEIHRISQIFPGTGHAFDFGLAAQDSLGADLAGDAGDFGGEGTELVH